MKAAQMPRLFVVGACALACMAEGAKGQEPDPNVPITARPRPDFDPLGIRAGGFLIFPAVSVASNYDDNVFATPNDTKDDFLFTFNPRIAVRSNFPRHSINWTVASEVGRYVDQTDENYWDYGTSLSGRLDITRSNRLTGSARFARDHERNDDPEEQRTTRRPVRSFDYGGTLGFEQDFNRINFALRGLVDRRDFRETDNDAPQDTRDRLLYGGEVRAGYFVSPRINTFLQGGYRREVRDTSDRGNPPRKRDNEVFDVRVGTGIDFTALLFGEVSVGWSKQQFDESDIDSNDDIAYGVGLTWNVTRLTTIRLNGSGGFVPSDVGTSNFENRIAARVDHELLRNLLIGGEFSYNRNDFQDTGRVDNRYDFGANINYLINRYLSVGGGYRFSTRDSDDNDREFDRNLVTVRLNAQL